MHEPTGFDTAAAQRSEGVVVTDAAGIFELPIPEVWRRQVVDVVLRQGDLDDQADSAGADLFCRLGPKQQLDEIQSKYTGAITRITLCGIMDAGRHVTTAAPRCVGRCVESALAVPPPTIAQYVDPDHGRVRPTVVSPHVGVGCTASPTNSRGVRMRTRWATTLPMAREASFFSHECDRCSCCTLGRHGAWPVPPVIEPSLAIMREQGKHLQSSESIGLRRSWRWAQCIAMKTQSKTRTLGDIVRQHIELLGVSDAEIARRIGTSSSMITLVSQNARPVPMAALEEWIQALEISDNSALVEFILLVRRSHKQGLEAVFAEYEREIAHLKRQIQRLQEGQTPDSDEGIALISEPIEPRQAIPWKSGPRNLLPGVTIGHGDYLPVSSRTGKPVDAVYSFALYESRNRIVGQDVGICLGLTQLEQRTRRLLKRITKCGLPQGWYGVRIGLLAVSDIRASQFWAISSPEGELLRTLMDHDDR